MTDPSLRLSREQRRLLLDALNVLPVFDDAGARRLLLGDLPNPLRAQVAHSNVKAVDLANILQVVEAWGTLDDGVPALYRFFDQVLCLIRGGEPGRQVQQVYDELRGQGRAAPAPPPPSLLRPTDATTVVLAYSPADEAGVAPLLRALTLRGLRVIADSPDTPLLAEDGAELLDRIGRGCDSVVFYLTPAALRDPRLARAADAARARQRLAPGFPVIPVLAGRATLAGRQVVPALAGLADLHPERLAGAGPADLRPFARRVLGAALSWRAGWDTTATSLFIRLSTYPHQPAVPRLHLDLDWRAIFGAQKAGPPAEQWAGELLPALADVAEAVARTGLGQVDAWPAGALPAAVALGYAFPPKGAVHVRWHQRNLQNPAADDVWTYTDRATPAPDLLVTPLDPAPPPAAPDIILELPIRRAEVTADVARWLALQPPPRPRWHLRAAPADGSGSLTFRDSAHAQACLQAIGRAVRAQWAADGAQAVHLFLAGPAAFAALLGQELYDRAASPHPIHLYTEDPADGYRAAGTLGAG